MRGSLSPHCVTIIINYYNMHILLFIILIQKISAKLNIKIPWQ